MAVGGSGYRGYKSWIGLAEETSWATKITSTSFLEFLPGESLNRTKESTKLEAINQGRNYLRRYLGNETVEGSFEAHLNVASDALIKLIKNGMGGTATSGGGATTGYSHYFGQGNLENSLTSFTIQKRIEDGANFDIYGCRVNSFTIRGEVGQPVMISFDIIGKEGTTSTDTVTVSLPTVEPLLWNNITFKTGVLASMTSVLASGTTEYIQKFELTVNNNLIADDSARSLGTTTVDFVKYGRADVSFKITQRYDTTTAYDRGFSTTPYSLGLVLDSTQTIGAGAGSTTYSMSLVLPKAYYKPMTPQIGNDGIIEQEIEFDVVGQSIGADIVEVRVANGTASY